MKKIVNGKKYDTGTAIKMAFWDNDFTPNDFAYKSETLYLKKTGEYFLYGKGGPRSKYAEPIGTSGWRGGEKIIPLTEEEARTWAMDHLSCDEYEELFGEVPE